MFFKLANLLIFLKIFLIEIRFFLKKLLIFQTHGTVSPHDIFIEKNIDLLSCSLADLLTFLLSLQQYG